MEDLACEFQTDFLDAVKVLEDFSSSDADLREVLKAVRGKIEAKAYSCAPNFWEDLRQSLGVIEQKRGQGATKSKAKQVLKQIGRLESKFWAKESLDMLRELDPESRLERLVDWISNFEATESGDQSSDPAVLYQVLNDVSVQKDMEASHREALTAAVKENLHKFPVSMQAMLERVGTTTGGGGVVGRALSDWRRRNQPGGAQPEPPPQGTPLLKFVPNHGANEPPSVTSADAMMTAAVAAHVAAPAIEAPRVEASTPMVRESPGAAGDDEDEDAAASGQLSKADVDPQVFERARRAVLAVLNSNSGECPRQHVRTLLKQAGVAGLPIAALGEEIFFSSTDVFLRRPEAILASPAAALAAAAAVPPGKTAINDSLKKRLVQIVSEAGGQASMARLIEWMQWAPGSPRHSAHGALKRCVAQVPELFYEPRTVFTASAAGARIAVLGPQDEEVDAANAILENAQETAAQAAPYVADPFAELIESILAWLQQGDGVLPQDEVLQLIRLLGFKVRAVIGALAADVFWCHPEADCEVLLRSLSGAKKHPNPLPDVYLHQQVHQQLVQNVKLLGSKAKLDKIAGVLGWNQKSELRRTYGTLRVVMERLREVFYDPSRIYLKKSLEGLVEWPVNREGRMGPQSGADTSGLRRWTPAADDPKAGGDPAWLHARRQIIGTLMSCGGQCEVVVLQQLLASLRSGAASASDGEAFEVKLEDLFEVGSGRDLSSVLFWSHREVRCLRPEAIDKMRLADDQISPIVRRAVVDAVRLQGVATPASLMSVIREVAPGETLDEEALVGLLARVPELFFRPDLVLLRRTVDTFTVKDPVVAEPECKAVEAEEGASGLTEAAAVPVGSDATEASVRSEASVAVDGRDDLALATPAADDSGGFFSFSAFTPANEASTIERSAKRARVAIGTPVVATPVSSHAALATRAVATAGWSDAPPWATEGAAVLVRGEEENAAVIDGVIIRASGASCVVRLQGGGAAGHSVERDIPTPRLLPVAPTVGATVQVVAGDRKGCRGTLVGLAGTEGVVQIGKMSYETLSMSFLTVMAT
eukprot:TRINITY_DN4832_c0_g1_i2.p1 TRINITY_DN4832_c0_g1~~TRINITY_DN4832_c0_g1_i2.p1  ORF type:complete len:1050 (+),score=202.78 TRINITY_DN4832_c0_g1_i2:229-3378(+)